MALKTLVAAFGMIVVASPLAAVQPESAPDQMAPQAGPDAKYCLRVELTGNVIEPVRCWTREKWADQGVDVDKEWPKEGVKVIG
jgi:hypothetical protein